MTDHRRSAIASALAVALASIAPAVHAQGTGPYYATPAWSQTLPDATRFILLANFGNKAFLDRNTGLVWATNPLEWDGTPAEADAYACQNAAFGHQWGWRLPAFPELLTLFTPLDDSPQWGSLYGTQAQATFIHYPPPPAMSHILAAKHGSVYRYMERQGEGPDWNILGISNGTSRLGASYVWCVRGPGGRS